MKRWVKVILAIVAALVVLLIAAAAALQLPPVQKAICNKVVKTIGEKTGLDINVGGFHFALFDRVILDDVFVADGRDTLVTCQRAAVSISPLSILTGNYKVNRLSLSHGTVYPSNFPVKEKTDDGSAADSSRFALPKLKAELGRLAIEDFRVVNYKAEGRHVDRSRSPRLIDFNDLAVDSLNLDIRNLKYDGSSASMDVRNISLKEAGSGLDLKTLSFEAAYDSTGLHISDFNLDDNISNLKMPDGHLYFDDFSDLGHFTDSVAIDATLNDALLDLRTIQFFADSTSFLELKLYVDGRVQGPLADIRSESLKVWSGTRETYLDIGAHLVGLPDARNTMASIKVNNSRTNTRDIAEIAYQCTPFKSKFNKQSISKLAPGTQFSFTGTLNGFFEDFVAYGAVNSKIGGGKVDIVCRSEYGKGYEILGFADVKDFDLGQFLQNKNLGKASCHASLSSMFANKPEETEYYIDEISVPKFEFNGYTYSNISGSGNWKQGEFEGRIVSADPNLKFMLQAILAPSSASGNSLYHAKLSLGHADLAALGFDKRELSTVRLNAEADMTQTGDGRLMGKINISDISCKSPDGKFDLDDIEVVTLNGKDRYMLRVNSDMLQARYRGSAFVTDIIPQIEALALNGKMDNLAARMKKVPSLGSDKFDLNVKALDLKNLLGYLAPGIHVENGTSISLRSQGDSTGTAKIKSNLLAFNNIFVQDLNANVDFKKDCLDARLGSQMIRIGDIRFADATVDALCADNNAKVDIKFCNDPDSLDTGHLKADVAFPDMKQSKQKMIVNLDKSFLRAGGQQWNMDPSSVYYADKNITINGFNLYNRDQGLNIDGTLSANPTDTCSFDIKDLDLALVNMFMKNPINLAGSLSGKGKVISIFSRPDVFADLVADSLSLADHPIGKLAVKSNWDDTLQRVNLMADNVLDGNHVLRASGYYKPEGGSLKASVNADKFGLGFIEPFISSLATDISGTLTADINVSGKLSAPDIVIKGGHLEQFGAKLVYTQVPYILDGYIDMVGPRITLRGFDIKDEEHGTGSMTGLITHNHFNDFNLDIRIKANDLLGFNTTISDNETFYGKAYAAGNVAITGPLNALELNIDAATRPGTVVNIPIGNATNSQTSVITFVDNRPAARLSTIDSLINLNRVKVKTEDKASGSALDVFVKIRATEDATLNLELDSNAGDALRVQGSGNVNISVKDNNFGITGDYTVSEGDYRLALLGLVTRDFSLNEGSSIHFTGDIMQSELDMTASYKTKASISPLLYSGYTDGSLRRPVNCGIRITDRLANPSLGFNIDIDDLDPTTKGMIDNTLNTEEKRMRQFLALILSGSFIPDEQSGIVNNTSVSYFNATEIMSSQLNSILQQLDIPIDLGFNYQPTSSGQDLFDVAVSTQLLNNRVSVNGNIGNRRYLTSNRDDIVGDVDVEVKLDRRGRTRLKLFSHSADEYSNYLDQTQRNGAGISYRQEFNNFKDLFRKKSRSANRKGAPQQSGTPSSEAKPDKD